MMKSRLLIAIFLIAGFLFISSIKCFAQIKSHIDLQITNIKINPESPSKGDMVLFTIDTEKKGSGKVEKVRLICRIRRYQVVDADLDFTNQSKIRYIYSWKALPGEQTFKCDLDPSDLYLETDEKNNEKEISFTVKLPKIPEVIAKDFIISPVLSSSFSRTPWRGFKPSFQAEPDLIAQKVMLDQYKNRIDIYVQNSGGGFTANWDYKVSWSSIGVDEGNCTGTREGTVKPYANIKISCPLPSNFWKNYNGKNLQFKVFLDTGDVVKEKNEINNLYYELIYVKINPDLKIDIER